MGLNAGKGQVYHHNMVHTLTYYLTNATTTGTVVLGWLPAGAQVIASGAGVYAAWSGTGNEQADIGFDSSEESYTADPNAFTETALDLDVGVGHQAGDVVSAANLYFSKPARVTAAIVNTDSTTGAALLYVTYVVRERT